ncbi:MAG TPA: thiolase family protein [Alphaproteobacteria bacterium]|jgi:acetyl-CoA acyltransferase|nr:thiolase family protein [Alphaproteobacteria bacterium]
MTEQKKVVIAGYVRSPFTPAGKGDLKDVRPDDLMAQTVTGLVKKTGVDPKLVDDLKLGCAMPEGEQGLNMARLVVLNAGLPDEIGGVTINRFCGSAMQAIHDAAGAISMGMSEAVICGGVESMSRVPMGGFNPSPNPDLYKKNAGAYMGMGETAENVADRKGISRQEQEEFSLKSQFKTAAAKKAGKYEAEIVPIVKKDGTVVKDDGCPRPGATAEDLAKLKPAFKADGSVTAATSSPVTDGATAVLVCSEEFALKHGLEILAEVKSFAVAGLDPEVMGLGPIPATEKAMKLAGITMDDVKFVEMNEAFASQSIACQRELKIADEKLNVHGGAIALGHPLGATGARITGKAAQLLHDEGKDGDYAISTQCIGAGQGITTVLKKYTPKP